MLSNTSVEAADSRLNMPEGSINETQQRHLPWGPPTTNATTCILTQEDYSLGYSAEFHLPLWAAFTVTPVTIIIFSIS